MGAPPTLTVTKIVNPSSDQSRFNLQIGGTSYVNGSQSTAGVGNGGSTGTIVLSPGTYTVGETLAFGDPILGANPNIGFYTNNISCLKNGSTNPFASRNFNTSPVSFTRPETVLLGGVTLNNGDNVVCTITNVRITLPPPSLPPQPPPTANVCGRFTGGGSIFLNGNKDLRVTHGFELHCNPADKPNNLEVNFGHGDQFHLTDLTTASCFLDTSIPGPGNPSAPFNTITGTGTGRFDGVAGATVSFTITDQGEPGKADTLAITIKAANGTTVLSAPATVLTFGNQQAHGCQGNQ